VQDDRRRLRPIQGAAGQTFRTTSAPIESGVADSHISELLGAPASPFPIDCSKAVNILNRYLLSLHSTSNITFTDLYPSG